MVLQHSFNYKVNVTLQLGDRLLPVVSVAWYKTSEYIFLDVLSEERHGEDRSMYM